MRSLEEARFEAYRLEEVARSICSSNALLVDDPNQPAMMMLTKLSAAGILYNFYECDEAARRQRRAQQCLWGGAAACVCCGAESGGGWWLGGAGCCRG